MPQAVKIISHATKSYFTLFYAYIIYVQYMHRRSPCMCVWVYLLCMANRSLVQYTKLKLLSVAQKTLSLLSVHYYPSLPYYHPHLLHIDYIPTGLKDVKLSQSCHTLSHLKVSECEVPLHRLSLSAN